ncbi:hypothetical protein BJX68DRAFT_277337 [Aspergillus pseudodeflectus]|uniref:BTB domain-containing protein n=1 Tax=Aspergillus pseudodeflectus TaxID=176178 RepID=A0ABR4JZW6_9EURO
MSPNQPDASLPRPVVNIRIGAETYNGSKALLCKHSPYFRGMFEGQFREAEEESAELGDVPGVVSTRSFELLLQWLYLGRFVLVGDESPTDQITATIELARPADMVKISDTTMAQQIALCIRAAVLHNPPLDEILSRSPAADIHCITAEHIEAASRLPKGHLARLLLASASTDAYLNSEDFKFSHEFHDVPESAGDLLQELGGVIKSVGLGRGPWSTFHDPFSGEELDRLLHTGHI